MIETMLTKEITSDFLVPEGDIASTVVDDVAKVCLCCEIIHESLHTLDAFEKVDNLILFPLLVQGPVDILNCLSEDSRKTVTHGGMSKGVLMVATISGPRRVVWIDLGTAD